MKRLTKFMVITAVVGLLTIATTLPAFAAHTSGKGPAVPVATFGLGNALTNVVANVPPGSPGEFGTDIAAFTIAAKNPAVNECALGAPCP